MSTLKMGVTSMFVSLLCFINPIAAQEATKVDVSQDSYHIFRGPRGHHGHRGHEGDRGHRGHKGHGGTQGIQGPIGLTGATGPAGTSGSLIAAADFFALMPGDNSASIAVGTSISFPQDGPVVGTDITRLSGTTFNLASIGTYMVQFQASVAEPGQLVVALNGAEIGNTVVGRATGTSQIVGTTLVNVTAANSTLEIRNPTGNSTALTLTPIAGGTHSVSAHLIITRIQ